MNIQEIDKWLDNEYGVSYTRLEELHDFVIKQDLKHREEAEKEIERLNKLISQREKKWEKWTTEKTILSTKMSDYLCKYQNIKREYTKQIKISTDRKKEIERLNKELEEIKSKDVYEELLELRGRVFKAIDYIKFHFNDMVANVLIDILKGSDKE